MSFQLTNHLGRETAHHVFDRAIPAELIVAPGTEVSLAIRDGSNGQITPKTTPQDLHGLNFGLMDPLTGPIFVEGAEPGDALSVEILDIQLGDWGWSGILPDFGLLADRYPGPFLKIWDTTADEIEIGNGHRFDLQPMIGVIGVAPEQPGPHAATVPTVAGGNIDVKYTQKGSRVLLPVFAEGGLLSLGDAHALQGDGELNGTAIECEADILIKVDLVKGAGLIAPVIDTPPSSRVEERYRSFLGVGPDLWEAARSASSQAAVALAAALKMPEDEAYTLLGIFAELRIHEIVDQPNWVVGCMVPLRIFG
ncbi:acetamidase/formamidase family protein [Actinacidiphila oryziradicis]|uniref:Acetamidase n=1 Tax=Actinacidiphila oryziradicis TaxID=2571141 RepID=A0A4U0SFH8_9ACTN|nr:acetamidase/formamidase family protein [Actinacidiphila oryziradicis]TKA08226.1 acetamidase [Actinacidiphila oryziradicis]